jgi:hypothetical protein
VNRRDALDAPTTEDLDARVSQELCEAMRRAEHEADLQSLRELLERAGELSPRS